MSGQIPIYAVVRVQNPPFWHGRSQLGHGGRSSPAAVSRCAAGAGLEGPTEHQAIIQAARMQLAPTLSVKSSSGFYTRCWIGDRGEPSGRDPFRGRGASQTWGGGRRGRHSALTARACHSAWTPDPVSCSGSMSEELSALLRPGGSRSAPPGGPPGLAVVAHHQHAVPVRHRHIPCMPEDRAPGIVTQVSKCRFTSRYRRLRHGAGHLVHGRARPPDALPLLSGKPAEIDRNP
jgi:hypothetical protein